MRHGGRFKAHYADGVEPRPRDQLANNPKLASEVRDDMIVRYVEAHRAATGDKLKEYIVPAAAQRFGVSVPTVWRAIKKRKTR